MSIYETIGMIWVILTSALATIGIFYFAYIGVRGPNPDEHKVFEGKITANRLYGSTSGHVVVANSIPNQKPAER